MRSKGEATPESKQEKLWRLRNWFVDLKGEELTALRMFHLELNRFNQKMNLIAPRTEAEADRYHFADCILGGRIVLEKTSAQEIYDIGSGNGFPGVVMAILAPERHFVLVESDARKVEFLEQVRDRLSLENVEVKHERFEELPPDSIQCVVSRNFSSMAKSVVVLRSAIRVGGEYFHFKGDSWVRELGQMPTQVLSVWSPALAGEYSLPGRDDKAQRAIALTTKMR